MAITGHLDADFASFYTACRQAEVELRRFETGSAKVESQLNRMTDSFSGRKIISDAQLMAEAVSRIGGPARLTESELRRVGAAAQEAVDKMNRMGIEPPTRVRLLADAADKAGGSFDGMGQSVRQVDNVLDLFGVNLGPSARALEDLEFAVGKTTRELGPLATAAVTAGAAFGGWKLGRFIAEVTEADTVISRFAARLMGYADVDAAEAAAKTDVLARASQTAGRAITDMSEAMAINEMATEKMIAANQKASDKFVENAAKVAALAKIDESNRTKLIDLDREYAVAQGARRAKEAEAEAARVEAVGKQIDADMQSAQAAKDKRDAYFIAEIEARKQIEQTNIMLEAQADAARKAAAAITVTRTYDNLDTEEGLAEFRRLNPGATLSVGTEYFKTHTLEDAVRSGVLNWYGNWANSMGGIISPPSMASIASSQPSVRNDLQVPINVNVSGVLDPRTVEDLASKVGRAIAREAGTKARVF